MATYYLAVNGQPSGPYTVDQLSQMNLQPESLVWNDSMPNWVQANSIPELQSLFAYQAPGYQQQAQYQQSGYQQPAYQQYQQQNQGYQQQNQGYQQGYGQPSAGYQRMVGFTEAIKMFFNKYAQFTGRSSRSEYWFACLGLTLLFIAIVFLGAIFAFAARSVGIAILFYVIYILFGLAVIVPSLALFWRRMHDIGKTGAWWFLGLVPFGGIVLFIFCCQESKPYENEYGPVPNTDSEY